MRLFWKTSPLLIGLGLHGMGCSTARTPKKRFVQPRIFISDNELITRIQLSDQGAESLESQGLSKPKELSFRPSKNDALGFSIGNNNFSLGAASESPVSAHDEARRGKSSYLDYQINFSWRGFGLDVAFQQYKGLYLSNTGDYVSGFDEATDPYIQEPSLRTSRFGSTFFYIFQPKNYTYQAAFDQTGYQKESGGSFLSFLSVDTVKIENTDESLSVLNMQTKYMDQYQYTFEDKQELQGSSYSWMIGYGYTLKSKYGPFLSALFALGTSYQFLGPLAKVSSAERTLGSRSTLRLALGLDRGVWFLGAKLINDQVVYPDENIEFAVESNQFEIFLGWRL